MSEDRRYELLPRGGRGEGRPVPVGIVTAIDPVLRDSLVAGVMLDVDGAVELRYAVDTGSGALHRLIVGPAGVIEQDEVRLDHPCVSCAMREDAVPALDRLVRDPRHRSILLVPPISADPSIVAGSLLPGQGAWSLEGAVAVLAASQLRHDLLDADTLAERALQWAAEDRRSVGEALAAQIEYSGLVVADAAAADAPQAVEVEAGLELLEHLRAPEQRLATSLHSVSASDVLGHGLDHAGGLRRSDPLSVEPYGGPVDCGTWTLDLCSDRPFHPQRFLDSVEALGAGRVRGRGRFWVPDRPGTVCQWDGAGGQVSIGVAADSGRDLPTTRMVVTGVEAADPLRIRAAFERSLFTAEEWSLGLVGWLGCEDLLAPWLGERGAGGRRAA